MGLTEFLNKAYFGVFKPEEYAGPFVRFLAFLIDFSILSIISYLLIVNFDLDYNVHSTFFDPMWLVSHRYSLLTNWLYFSVLESNPSYQATIGKSIFRLKVVDIYGKRISFGKASVRIFSKYLSGITLGLGYIMIVFNKKRQGLHDIAAGTLVKPM